MLSEKLNYHNENLIVPKIVAKKCFIFKKRNAFTHRKITY